MYSCTLAKGALKLKKGVHPACAKGRTRNMGSIGPCYSAQGPGTTTPSHPFSKKKKNSQPPSSRHVTRVLHSKWKDTGIRTCAAPLPPSLGSRDPQPPPVAEDGALLKSFARPVCSQADAVLKWRLRRPGPHGSATPTARCATPPSSP